MGTAALSLLDASFPMCHGGFPPVPNAANPVFQTVPVTDAMPAPPHHSSSSVSLSPLPFPIVPKILHPHPLATTNRYKISFVALDGTDEAEMICFGDVARRIIGKPVQQLLRTAANANTYPPDVSKIVNLRFTFAVALTQQSYYRQYKTYQVISVVTSYGRLAQLPPIQSPGNQNPASGQGDQTPSGNSLQVAEEESNAVLSSLPVISVGCSFHLSAIIPHAPTYFTNALHTALFCRLPHLLLTTVQQLH